MQACSEANNSTYKTIADNLWAAHELRKALFSSLWEARSDARQTQTYFTLSALLDALRRRHVDLYPTLPQIPHLNKLPPKRQVEVILKTLVCDRTVGSAAEEVLTELRSGQIAVRRNITEMINSQLKSGLPRSLDHALDVVWIHSHVCPPPQTLVGAILSSIPVRTRVAEARNQISEMLHEHKLPSELWQNITSSISHQYHNKTIITWLSEIIRAVANHTSDTEGTEAVAAGILHLESKPIRRLGGGGRMETEEIALRLHPTKLSGYFSKPKEDKDVYRIDLEKSPPLETIYWPEIPVPGRMRRSASKDDVTPLQISPALKELSSAIVSYTISLLNLKFGTKHAEDSKIPLKPRENLKSSANRTKSFADFQSLHGAFYKKPLEIKKTFYPSKNVLPNRRSDQPGDTRTAKADKVKDSTEMSYEKFNDASQVTTTENNPKPQNLSPSLLQTLESSQIAAQPEPNYQKKSDEVTMNQSDKESNENSRMLLKYNLPENLMVTQSNNSLLDEKSENAQGKPKNTVTQTSVVENFSETRKSMERLHNIPQNNESAISENLPSPLYESNDTFQNKTNDSAGTPSDKSSRILEDRTETSNSPLQAITIISQNEKPTFSEISPHEETVGEAATESGDSSETSDGILKNGASGTPETSTQIESNQYKVSQNDQTIQLPDDSQSKTSHKVDDLENSPEIESSEERQESQVEPAQQSIKSDGQDPLQPTPATLQRLTRSLDEAIQRHLENNTNSSLLSFLPAVSEEDALLLQPFKEFLTQNAHSDTEQTIESIAKLLLKAKPPKNSILKAVIDSYIFHISAIFKKKLTPREQNNVRIFFDYVNAHPELGKLNTEESKSVGKLLRKAEVGQDVPDSVKASLPAVRRWIGLRARKQRNEPPRAPRGNQGGAVRHKEG